MKKIIFILIGILFILPCVVFADMGSPAIIEYNASVNNPDGVDVYVQDEDGNYIKSDLKAPYGTIFTIGWEEEDDGYAEYEYEKFDGDENLYYVSLKDLTLIEKNYIPKEDELLPKEKAKVLKDVIIKTGPAMGYESTGITIKSGTEIEIRLFGEYDDEEGYIYDSSNPWMYVEYNNTKGFINSYGASIAYREIKDNIITNSDIDIRDPKTDKVLGVIPANTVFKNNLYHLDDWSYSYYVNYKGTVGIAYRSDFIWNDSEAKFTASDKINIYNKLSDNMETDIKKLKVVGTLNAGDSFNSSYYDIYNNCKIYYEKDNLKGWIYTEINYDDDSDEECINLNITYLEDELDYEEEDNPDMTYEEEEPSEPTDIQDEPTPSGTSSSSKKTNSLYTLYICIGLAAIMAIVTAASIKLINKKKMENN